MPNKPKPAPARPAGQPAPPYKPVDCIALDPPQFNAITLEVYLENNLSAGDTVGLEIDAMVGSQVENGLINGPLSYTFGPYGAGFPATTTPLPVPAVTVQQMSPGLVLRLRVRTTYLEGGSQQQSPYLESNDVTLGF